jgi:membrane-associated phospholipid phosphatase
MIKLSVGRRRPYKQFGDGTEPALTGDNVSFSSGHTSLGFAITASAGLICHWRNYWTEPYVWGTGIFLSLSTAYLRMGADKHYLSDVLVGGAIGVAAGLTVPRLLRHDIKIVPIEKGVAFAGTY